MPNLFSSGAGRVVQIEGSGLPMTLRIGNFASNEFYGFWRGFKSFKSIIAGLGYQPQCGYQILHTLNKVLYIYDFGDRAADLSINGLTFVTRCDDDPDQIETTGIEHVIEFYKHNRLSGRGMPVDITIGATIAMTAFMVGLRVGVNDAATGVGEFNMIFKTAPL